MSLNRMFEAVANRDLGELDPTNVLTAGDFADQSLSLPEHAVALYDAALDFMDKHPESIADDTDCAAASLNLMDLLAKAGQARAAVTAARRAARLPVKRAEQNIQIAVGLSQGRDAKMALMLFQRGKAGGLSAAAAAMGVTVNDLNQMERVLVHAVSVGGD
jgi:hypothetical protein